MKACYFEYFENAWCLSACKKSTSSLTSFLRYCKNIANLLFWKLWECLTIPIKNHSINFQETFMLICMQQITHSLTFFLRYCKEISSLLFWVIWASLVTPKKIESIWRNFWCLFASKKRTSFFPFSLRYCKDIANLLFWVLFPGKLMTKLSKKSKNPYGTECYSLWQGKNNRKLNPFIETMAHRSNIRYSRINQKGNWKKTYTVSSGTTKNLSIWKGG